MKGTSRNRVRCRLDPSLECQRDEAVEPRVGDIPNDPALESEGLHARAEAPLLYLSANQKKSSWQIDNRGSKDAVWSQAGLIRIGAEGINTGSLLHRLKQSQCCGIGVVMKHVCTHPGQRESGFPSRCSVIEVVQVDLTSFHPRIYRPGSANPSHIGSFDWWQLDPSHESDDVGLGHATGDHAGKVTGFFESEDERCDVTGGPLPRRHDENRLRILARDPLRRTLEFEAVREDEIVPLGGVTAERFFLLRRSVGLYLGDPGSQGVADLNETAVGPGVPGSVRNRPWSDEADAQARRLTVPFGATSGQQRGSPNGDSKPTETEQQMNKT